MHHLRHARLPCLYIVIGDDVLGKPEAEARDAIRTATSYLVQSQTRAGLPPYWLRVLESVAGLHANLILPVPPGTADRLRRSAFGNYVRNDAIQEVGSSYKDWQDLKSYLCKERTPQANFSLGRFLGPRLPGSHRLGDGGGDRVQLSTALAADALVAGRIAPWQRTFARPLVRPTSAHIAVALPPTLLPVEKPLLRPVQLPLFSTLPLQVLGTGEDMRAFRRQTGMSQDALTPRLGLRDRSHIANFERGHDGLSLPRRRLLRHLIETATAAA